MKAPKTQEEPLPTSHFERLAKGTLKHAETLAQASSTKLLGLYCRHAALLFFVFVLGALLLYARKGIFWLIPQLIEQVIPVTVSMDLLLSYFSIESFVVSEAWHIISDVVKVVTAGRSDIPVLGASPNLKFYTFSPREVKTALNTFSTTCSNYDSVASVMGRSIRVFMGSYICPVLRYIYPVRWLYDAAHALLGWASPDPTPAGFDGENNCAEDPLDFSWVCAAVGTGYIILEVLLPIFIALVFLEAVFVPLVRVLFDVLQWQNYLGSIGFTLFANMLVVADKSIESIARRFSVGQPTTTGYTARFKTHGE